MLNRRACRTIRYYAVADDRCGFDWDLKTDKNWERGQPFNYFTQGEWVVYILYRRDALPPHHARWTHFHRLHQPTPCSESPALGSSGKPSHSSSMPTLHHPSSRRGVRGGRGGLPHGRLTRAADRHRDGRGQLHQPRARHRPDRGRLRAGVGGVWWCVDDGTHTFFDAMVSPHASSAVHGLLSPSRQTQLMAL
jgi:hypothetical protein